MSNQEAPPPIPDGLDGLGARLSLAILHLAISQSEFARRLGSSPGFVSDIVRGVKKPGAEFLAGIKQTFGISTDWLLIGDGTMFGGAGINLDLLRAIRLQVAVARAAVVEDNPTAKALLLFTAFIPPFLDPHRNLIAQTAAIALTYAVVEFCVEYLVASAAHRVRPWLARTGRRFNKVCGGFFVVFGLALPIHS